MKLFGSAKIPNGPFFNKLNGRMVYNSPHWRAMQAYYYSRTGKSKTKKSQAWMVEVALFWKLLHTFTLQHGGFCTIWSFVIPSCPVSRVHGLLSLISLNPLSLSFGEATFLISSIFSSPAQQSFPNDSSLSSVESFICFDKAIVIFFIASLEIFLSESPLFSYSDHLGEVVTTEAGSRFGKNPFLKKSSSRISLSEGLLAGFACSIFWMSFAAPSDIREGIVYSLFRIRL